MKPVFFDVAMPGEVIADVARQNILPIILIFVAWLLISAVIVIAVVLAFKKKKQKNIPAKETENKWEK